MKNHFHLILLLILLTGAIVVLGMQVLGNNRDKVRDEEVTDMGYEAPVATAPGNQETEPFLCNHSRSEIDTSGWQTYRNEEYGFQFKVPSNWQIFESTSYEQRLSLSGGSLLLYPVVRAFDDYDQLSVSLIMNLQRYERDIVKLNPHKVNTSSEPSILTHIPKGYEQPCQLLLVFLKLRMPIQAKYEGSCDILSRIFHEGFCVVSNISQVLRSVSVIQEN